MTAPSPVWNRNFSRRASDRPSVVAELPRRHGVAIGSRWTPSHAVHSDPDSGIFWERNPRMETSAELDVQRALLEQRRNNRSRYWIAALALPAVAYLVCKVWQ